MGIFLIILIIVILCWPLITKWLRQFLAHRTEDYLRKATGMPPRPGSREEKRQQRASRQTASEDTAETYYSRQRSQRKSRRNPNEPIIPREYAEDVEFVETIDYSDTKIGEEPDRNTRQYHESQVTDVEWVDIKKKA